VPLDTQHANVRTCPYHSVGDMVDAQRKNRDIDFYMDRETAQTAPFHPLKSTKQTPTGDD
jgi:hypothetical protein